MNNKKDDGQRYPGRYLARRLGRVTSSYSAILSSIDDVENECAAQLVTTFVEESRDERGSILHGIFRKAQDVAIPGSRT